MSKLLDQLDKKPFQAYTIQHGIERVRIQIPLEQTKVFEDKFAALSSTSASLSTLLELVAACNGKTRKVK